MYILTVWENVLIIVFGVNQSESPDPQYFFLQQLSISDLLETANMFPSCSNNKHKVVTMSLVGCFTQLYFFGCFVAFQLILLTIMSYDRYLAICNPLRYSCIMNHSVCVKFVFMSWLVAIGMVLISVIN
ncbi:hypothetical protein GDO86_007048 [Hymenochirus boettgeri]|uniref:G-protein coupled receptors family 1 profile domain-containing protein n=1 Tax=Hymenochirus boettgeri TaxID=247094 RepID=A0A8T2JDC8_9PIPI|nr:hypothetical protein GDO86_007048 [Hymenochirus boettgeri]